MRTERRDTPVESTEAFLTGLAEVVDGLRDDSVAAVGIGIPSTIDQREGTSVFAVHVPLEGVPLRERAEQYLGLPVAIDNDANAAAVAEWTIGAGRGTQYMIMLTLGTGIGGGLIPAAGSTADRAAPRPALGHMVLEFDGPECRGFCTGRGHFEYFASGSAATARAGAVRTEADARQLVAAARGRRRARGRRAGRVGRKLGAGLASLVNVFDPEMIVIGGGFGDALRPSARACADDAPRRAASRDRVRVVAAGARRGGRHGRGADRLRDARSEPVPLAVCATPIGNLEDVTLRVLRELAEADLVLCEDTRRTRTLLSRHGISAKLLSYHEHNEAKRTAELLPRLVAGERMALVSDAGPTGISDPCNRLVAAAIETGVPVTVLPGASAVETALVASGFQWERYQFVGYLPRGSSALAALWDELGAWPHAVVAFESATPAEDARVAAVALPERPVAVSRELTKAFEEVVRGVPADVLARSASHLRGDHPRPRAGGCNVLGCAGRRSGGGRRRAVAAGLHAAGCGRARVALTSIPRGRLYRRSL